MPKLRRFRRRRLTSGFCTVSSIAMNAARNTAAMMLRLRMKGDSNQSSLLPSSSTVCSAESPMAMVTMPAQSPSLSSDSCMGVFSSVKASAMTIMMLGGVFTKKMVCQP